MSHEKSKEQVNVKKQATKSLKEKRAAKKAKKAEKNKQKDGTRLAGIDNACSHNLYPVKSYCFG